GSALAAKLFPDMPAEAPTKPRQLPTVDSDMTYVDEARFSPDGKLLVSAGAKNTKGRLDNLLLIWEASTGKLVATLKTPEGVGAAVDLSRAGKLLAAANVTNNTITVWDVGTWKERATLEDHRAVTEVLFSRNGKLLASRSCAFAGQGVISDVKLWDVATGKER